MMRVISARASRPFSWGAVFAGVVVGAVASMAILAIGAFITFLFGLSFTLTGFMGLFWFALSAIIGAFVAGNIAVNAQAPARNDDLTYNEVSKGHATLTGTVTAALLVLFTTFFTISGIGSIIGTTANVAGSVGSAIGSAIGSTAQTAAVLGASNEFDFNGLPDLQKQLSKINEDDIAQVIANNDSELNEKEVKAVGNVIKQTLKNSEQKVSKEIKHVDLSNVDEYLKARYGAVKEQLTGDELIARLQRQGLSRDQAVDVQQYLVNEANEIEQKAEQTVAQAKHALKEAESAARSAARWAAISWLISALLTFLATLVGARTAAGRLNIRD